MFTRIIISKKHERGKLMNQQEVISKLKAAIPENNIDDYQRGETAGLNFALLLLAELDEPEKPVVPQFVADWIEWCKKNKITLLGADTAICNNKNIRSLDAAGWAMKNQETFVKAWIYGYEVKKKKLYTVEIPNPNGGGYSKNYLAKNKNGKVELFTWSGYTSIQFADDWKQEENAQLTESEIKKDFEWAWQFAKEVEQCNQRL